MARTKTAPANKSEALRARLSKVTGPGQDTLSAAATDLHMNYAFAYGVLGRFADKHPEFNIRWVTGERSEKRVRVLDSGTVEVRTDSGVVIVSPEGKVTRRKS